MFLGVYSSSPESDGVEIWLKRIVASTTTYNITVHVIFVKRSPGQLDPKKLTNQHFYKKTLIKKNLSFKI